MIIIPIWRSQSCTRLLRRLLPQQGGARLGVLRRQLLFCVSAAPLWWGFFGCWCFDQRKGLGCSPIGATGFLCTPQRASRASRGLHEHSSEGTHGMWSLRLTVRTTLTQSPLPAFSSHFSFQYSRARSLVRILLYPATNSCGSLVWLLETDLLLEWNIVCTPCLAGCLGTTARSLDRGCSGSVCVSPAPLHDCICVHCMSRKCLPLISLHSWFCSYKSLFLYILSENSQQTGSGIIGVAPRFEGNHKSETSIISLWSFSKQRWRIYSTWDSKGETAGGYCRRYWFS